ncbi:MAG: hypothetical protein WDW36_006331 [Sanguina aurantia]
MRLCQESLTVETETGEVEAWLKEHRAHASAEPRSGGPPPASDLEVAQRLLLQHLLATPQGAPTSASNGLDQAGGAGGTPPGGGRGSARAMLASQLLQELLASAERDSGAVATAGVRSALLLECRQLQLGGRQAPTGKAVAVSGAPGSDGRGTGPLQRPTALCVSRWVMMTHGLGQFRGSLLAILAQAGTGGGKQDGNAAGVRAKAIKALGAAIEFDPRVLLLSEVQAGVKGALADDSVLVREAAVELLGKYISSSPDLALMYFDIISQASHDGGLAVRKRATRILWACVTQCGDAFPPPGGRHHPGGRRSLAVGGSAGPVILGRAGDAEESMRKLAADVCREMWFGTGSSTDTEHAPGPAARRAPPIAPPAVPARAQRLAEVSASFYAAGGSSIHVPLANDAPLLVVLRTAIHQTGKQESEATRSGVHALADALLARVLQLQDVADPGAERSSTFPPLLALHALCCVDVALCQDPRDPQKFVRCLAPYLKAPFPDARVDEPTQRRAAECLLCILSTLDACLRHLPHLEDDLAASLVPDLARAIRSHRHTQVLAAACQCLCSLAALQPACARELVAQGSKYFIILEGDLLRRNTATSQHKALYSRYLFTLGQLCRYGAHTIDRAAAEAEQRRLAEARNATSAAAAATASPSLARGGAQHPASSGVSAAGSAGARQHDDCGWNLPPPPSAGVVSDAQRERPQAGGDRSNSRPPLPAELDSNGPHPSASVSCGNGSTMSAPGASNGSSVLQRQGSRQPPATTHATSFGLNSNRCLQLFVGYFYLPGADMPIRDKALMAMGLLFIARPQLMMDVGEVRPLLKEALHPVTSPPWLKSRVLTFLGDLLRADEESMVVQQRQSAAAASSAQQASTLASVQASALATRNGEGDTCSVSSGLLQQLCRLYVS